MSDAEPRPRLILASESTARKALLRHAGVPFSVAPARVDEEAARGSAALEPGCGEEIATFLAELKAIRISRRYPATLVIGADQVLELDGECLAKPRSVAEARDHLRRLRGRTHALATAVCAAEGGRRVWGCVETPRLTMRAFSDRFLDHYLEQAGERLLSAVGAYQVERSGIQLFSRIEGDYFAILGLPLIPLLDYLRARGVLEQ